MMRRAAALALLVAVGGCNSPLRVGVVLPEKGAAAVYGASVKSGVRLGFADAFASGGAPPGLEVVYRDSGSDPARAAGAAEALYESGAPVVIAGVTSAEAKALIPVADRQGAVLLSPSASAPDLARVSRFFFRVYPSDELEGVKAADFLTLVRRARTVLVLQEDNDYTRGLLPVFVREFGSRGGRVAGSVRLDEAGWQGQVRGMLGPGAPDGVYICGYGEAILGALRLLRSMGYRGTMCTTSAFSVGALLARAASLAEGVFFPLASVDTASQKEPVRSFVRRYRAAYSLTPDVYAAHGYDAALAVLAALRGGGERSGAAVAQRLRSLSGIEGVTGPLAFDEVGNIRRALRNQWIHNGRIEDYDAVLERERPDGGAR